MAQWFGQFSGLTHDTKVQDAEDSLRKAIETYTALPDDERKQKVKSIHALAERLLSARLKSLRARISALTEPGKRSDLDRAASLQTRAQEIQSRGMEAILEEFEFNPRS